MSHQRHHRLGLPYDLIPGDPDYADALHQKPTHRPLRAEETERSGAAASLVSFKGRR